ncbi:MAG: DUF1823 family protein [Leptolyngbyaceae cyanobacterium T60_A2020_046]|nr:DUF1823 family protein [Leptolyngbyaceae cyanobacterium T60_A2020_046]
MSAHSSTLPPLTQDTIWAILNDTLDDDTVNALVWDTLGYCFDNATQTWNLEAVDSAWATAYPTPPNFIDSRPATVQLTRAIPKANKQLLKEVLGFKGYSVDQLIPRLTRRATMANWLLSVMVDRGDLLTNAPQ